MKHARTRWRPDPGRRALKTLAAIEASIAALADEDLLDLVDIMGADGEGALGSYARAEMNRRNLSL